MPWALRIKIFKSAETIAAVLGLSLQINLPGAAKQIEIVDEVTPERRLQSSEDIADAEPQRLRLLAIDVEIDRRRAGAIGREYAGRRGSWLAAATRPWTTLAMATGSAPSRFSSWIFEAARGREPYDGRQVEWQHVGGANLLGGASDICAISACTESAGPVRSAKAAGGRS